MSSFLEITSNDNWFKQHPEKIAGVEYETTSFYFPIMVKGTKEDVLRVTGINDTVQVPTGTDKEKRIRIANANAKARLITLSLGQEKVKDIYRIVRSVNYRNQQVFSLQSKSPSEKSFVQLSFLNDREIEYLVKNNISFDDSEAIIRLRDLGRLGVTIQNKETIAFNKQIIKAMKKGYEPTDIFHLGKPFGELEKHIPDYKIVMTGKVLSKAMTKDKDHQLNWANFIDLPFFLNNPTAIFKSETVGYVVLTEVYDVNNKPVMISLHINKKMVITNIASLYVRNYETYKRWINEKLHLYINKKSDLFNYTQATIAVGSNKSQYKDIKK